MQKQSLQEISNQKTVKKKKQLRQETNPKTKQGPKTL